MSDAPGGTPLDVFREFGQTVSAAHQTISPFLQRRRQTQFVDAVTKARRRTQQFQTELRSREDWEGYEVDWEREQQNIANDIAENLGDPNVQNQFYQWWTREQESARQQISKVAWNREVAHGVTTLERGIETAHELTDYGKRREQVRFIVDNAYSAGYIDELEAERLLNQNYERIVFDRATDTIREVHEEGGYYAASEWIGSDNGLNETQRRDLRSRLSQWDRDEGRRARERATASIDEHIVAYHEGRGSIRAILNDERLSIVPEKRNQLINLHEIAEDLPRQGDGETVDEGETVLSELRALVDTGNIEPLELYSRAFQARKDGLISDSELNRIVERSPLQEMAPLWNTFDAAMQDAIDAGEEITEQDKNRYRRQLEEKAQRFFTTAPGGELVPRQNYSENEIMDLAENYVREEIMGERIMERVHRKDFAFEDDPWLWGADLNSAEVNLRAIDEGRLIGQTRREEYAPILEDMSYEHKTMLQTLPGLEGTQWAGFDRDGRPVFTANTPAGRRAVALFTVDPVTKEQFVDERPYIWDRDNQVWIPLPEGAPANAARADSTAGGASNTNSVQGIMPE